MIANAVTPLEELWKPTLTLFVVRRTVLNLAGMLVTGLAWHLLVTSGFAQGPVFTTLTITNPTPAAGDSFGISLAAVGNDRMVIGAPGAAEAAGAVYLFRTDGALITTFTNPTPAAYDYFGRSVTALGYERVLIGAYLDDLGATDAGAAYLSVPTAHY